MADTAKTPNLWAVAVVTVLGVEGLGVASAWLSNSGFGNSWFDALRTPPFMPPGWAFGLVWPLLYALLGISAAMIIVTPPSPRRQAALTLFAIQLVLNFAWSPVFFAGHDIRLAKIIIFAITAVAAAAAGQFLRLRKLAGLLLIPYLAWLIFATSLNATIEDLNPGAGHSLLVRANR